MKRGNDESFVNYKERLFIHLLELKQYLKGRMTKVGSVYVPKEPRRKGKFAKKRFNFKKAKARRKIQKISRRRNRRR